jgi:hypothetical protein
MTKRRSPESIPEIDAEIADLESQLKEAKARYEIELAKVAELTERVVEDMKRQLGEHYIELMLTEMEPGERRH